MKSRILALVLLLILLGYSFGPTRRDSDWRMVFRPAPTDSVQVTQAPARRPATPFLLGMEAKAPVSTAFQAQ
ncbi:hypothetical protein SAMN05421823_102252 [Catalinimonas alkaloidigena]|uniref:Uncharacterized protein n=1 Tax=Catalinimonas alkaloidigena TaxID=1075417 RepID=A0A1G9ACG8_9BACT|nr:hypothetical protein [Catalinimonas alkaloidigena]SDK25082.1 hypothetical protein SAMN05421823_102252 [Catalinimonas alkaloidigena]